ncbi:taste receptor type 2 member 40-like [Pseudophryne corroboree]|uniref:taste receptor type 2 member 40-like n=1 Tax=Pseudophryne corroboree TaxID=495146 RepID=UPI0030817D2E
MTDRQKEKVEYHKQGFLQEEERMHSLESQVIEMSYLLGTTETMQRQDQVDIIRQLQDQLVQVTVSAINQGVPESNKEIRSSKTNTTPCEDNMNIAVFILLSSVCCSVIFIGLFLNTFVVTKILIWWQKGQTIRTSDIIMASLGAGHYDTALIFVGFCSLWWGTVLCVFYCVKITNYSNRLFLRLKMNISRMVPWLLLTSLLVSFLSSLPNIWGMYPGRYMNSSPDSNSSSIGNGTVEANYVNVFIIYFAGSIAPFLIFCAAICLLIVSLLKHTRNMSNKDSGFTNTQLDVHISVIKNMVSFLLFYALYFISSHLLLLSLQLGDSAYVLLCSVGISAYPSLHSIVLISSHAKLKRSLCSALHCAQKT